MIHRLRLAIIALATAARKVHGAAEERLCASGHCPAEWYRNDEWMKSPEGLNAAADVAAQNSRMSTEILLAFMEEYFHMDAMQAEGCRRLKGNTSAPVEKDVQADILKYKGLETVLLGMGKHLDAAKVQEECSAVLHNLAVYNAEARKALVKHHGARSLLRAMRTHPTLHAVSDEACGALHALAVHSRRAKRQILELEGLRLTLKAIGHMEGDGYMRMLVHCTKLLNSLVVDDSAAVEDFASLGAAQVVVKSVSKYTGLVEAQVNGCRLLQSLAELSDEENANVCSAGGIRAVVMAMAAHPGSATLQGECAVALQALATQPASHAMIAAVGGIAVLVTAMATHAGEEMIQEAACFALYNIAHRDERLRDQIISMGGIDLARRAELVSRTAAQQLLRALKARSDD
eukprot:TRINITY_DN101708_c0_g1_i1.p1 TRINITY_DN101708_c0_g1~~TRINITY_DN101708_c0_g1_i1.p1  ORF type:complete len:404 (-),score=98.10 TRINITY_DN101708_c0_g1_i1:124-1335(-)